MSIFSNLQPSPKVSRNAFDLSARHVFSAKFGPIQPVHCVDTIPGSHYEIDINQLLRSQPLQTAAFTGFKINYDVAFVPYNFLNHGFNQMIAGRGHNVSTLFGNQSNVPVFPAVSFGACVALLAAFERYSDELLRISSDDMLPITDRKPQYYMTSDCAPGNSCVQSCLVNLDMLGYGNYLPLSDLFYNVLKINYDYGEYSTVLDALNNRFGDTQSSIIFYGYELVLSVINDDIDGLFQTLFPTIPFSFPDVQTLFNDTTSYSLLRVLAYNKCFESFYRSTYYTSKYNFSVTQPEQRFLTPDLSLLSSIDFHDETYSINFDGKSMFLRGLLDIEMFNYFVALFSLKHHLYKRDMFTGVLPSTQFGNVSVVNSDSVVRSLRNSIGITSGTHNAFVSPQGYLSVSQDNMTLSGFTLNPEPYFSILNLRRADALQRFRERMLRAGDDVRSVFEAHGWPMPSSQMSELPIFLGSFDGNFDINTVAATSESDKIELGQLGANGVGTVSGKKIYFDAKDFGVILVLFHLTKSAEYDNFGIDYANMQIEQFDFPFPEFQNISLSPVSTQLLDVLSDPQGDILGYLPASFGYKTAVDKVHGNFYSSFEDYFDFDTQRTFDFAKEGVFASFVAPKFDLRYSRYEAFLYEDIHAVDTIFAQSATPSSDTDHFLVNCFVDVKAVQPLPVIGLPI